MFLENGENKTINKLDDLPKITTKLLEVNLRLITRKKMEGNNFGMPTLMLSMFLIKFLSKKGLRKKACLLLWEICEDLQTIENLYNIEVCEGYILLKRQSEIKEKFRLVNKVNCNLSQLSWFDKFFIKKKFKKFHKEMFPLIYDDDIEGIRSRTFGVVINHLSSIFMNDFQIPTGAIIKSIIPN